MKPLPFLLGLIGLGTSLHTWPLTHEPKQTLATKQSVAPLLDQARLWEIRQRPDLARQVLDKLFRVEENNPEGIALLARIELAAEQRALAENQLARLRLLHPNSNEIGRLETLLRLSGPDKDKLRQARLLARSGRTLAALAAFKDIYPDGPPSGDLALEYWQTAAALPNSWAAVRDGLTRLTEEYPGSEQYRLSLATHLLSRPPINKQALATVIQLSPHPQLGRQAKAAWRRTMLRLDAVASSRALIENYLQEEPGDSAVRERYVAIGQSIEAYRRLLADPAYRAKLEALALLKENRPEETEAKLLQALSGRPQDAEVLGGLGLLRMRQGYHAEARGYFSMAATHDPENRSKWQGLELTAQYWGLLREANDIAAAGDTSLALDKLAAARALDRLEPQALAEQGSILAAAKRYDESEASYRAALQLDATHRASLTGLIELFSEQKQRAAAANFIANLSLPQRQALGESLDKYQAGLLREDADLLITQKRDTEALPLLEKALLLDKNNPWLHYDMARLLTRLDRLSDAVQMFEMLLVRQPDDTAARYALALFQSGQDANLPALQTLEQVPLAERTENMTRLQRRVWIRYQIRLVETMARSHRTAAAIELLVKLEKSVSEQPELLPPVAFAWTELGDTTRARRIMAQAASRHASELDASWHIDHARILELSRADTELLAKLQQIESDYQLFPSQQEAVTDLRESLLLAQIEALRLAGNFAQARTLLEPFLTTHPQRIRAQTQEARLLKDLQQYAAADAVYLALINNWPEAANNYRLARIDLALNWQSHEAIIELIKPLLNQALTDGQHELTTDLIERLIDLGETERAHQALSQLASAIPDNPRVLILAGQLARLEGKFDEAIKHFQQALRNEQFERSRGKALPALSRLDIMPATAESPPRLNISLVLESITQAESKIGGNYRQLGEMLDKRMPWLAAATDWHSRSGTPGISQYHSVEIPLEWRQPWQNGQIFFRTDMVHLSAGSLNLSNLANAENFGSVMLCQNSPNPCDKGEKKQEANGASFSVGFERDDIRVDIGSTPLGFPVQTLLGGLRKKGDLGPFSYSLELSRRPLTSSLLSFAGTRDPHTGTTWGGVTANGLRLGLSRDNGGAFGAWSSLGLHQLTGKNVQDNNRMQLMAGGYWRLVNETDHLLSLGLTGMHWRHSKNAGEYTLGHGGYYSPKTYSSLSVPLTWGQRYVRFSYTLRAAIGKSQSTTAAAPYFPTRPDLQALAGNPIYSEGNGKGTGYSFASAWEYQVDPRLFIGGRLEIERSTDYTPNRFLIYLRYAPDSPAARPVFFPPESIMPTSQF